jgi:alanine racemase
VVKSDAYRLGAEKIAPALARAGCHTFFVALPEEGVVLRSVLPTGAVIYILNGVHEDPAVFAQHDLRPVLNSFPDLEIWRTFCAKAGRRLPFIIHLDTGMSRLGLTADDVSRLSEMTDCPVPDYWMSHLACSDEPENPMNARQKNLLDTFLARLPVAPVTFGASGGVLFLNPSFHYDMVRPGIALYNGIRGPLPLEDVVGWQARILQIRTAAPGDSVGYGATHTCEKTTRIATIGCGYSHGYPRTGQRTVSIGGIPAPVIGRTSMELITADVSRIPENVLNATTHADLLWDGHSVVDFAEKTGTIGYQVITAAGAALPKVYQEV